jgi:hypothetical protein
MPGTASATATPASPGPAPTATPLPPQATPPEAGPALDCNAIASLQVEAVLDYDKEIEAGRHCLYRLRVTNTGGQELEYFWHLYADNDAHTFTPGWETRMLAPGEALELEFDAFYWTNGVWSYYLADRVAAIPSSDACRQQANAEDALAALEALAQPIQYYCGP